MGAYPGVGACPGHYGNGKIQNLGRNQILLPEQLNLCRAWNKDLKVYRHNIRTWSVCMDIFKHFQILYYHYMHELSCYGVLFSWLGRFHSRSPSMTVVWHIVVLMWTVIHHKHWKQLVFAVGNLSAELLLQAIMSAYARTFWQYVRKMSNVQPLFQALLCMIIRLSIEGMANEISPVSSKLHVC